MRSPCIARLVPRADPDWLHVLHLAFGYGFTPTDADSVDEIRQFLETTRNRGLDIECLAACYRESGPTNAVLGVVSPGRQAMVIAPWGFRESSFGEDLEGSLALAMSTLFSRDVQIVETLTPPGVSGVDDVLLRLGFRNLTRLIYLRRPVTDRPPHPANVRTDLEWVPFSARTEHLFLQTVESTYAQTLDCPELTGLRSMSDVLAGHRAAAEFDPSRWLVALLDREAVGVLLLGYLPVQNAMEVVYMGVPQPARGQGVADALLARALSAAEASSAKYLALAVDRRNAPARRVYARWGFLETGTREAWIATRPQERTKPTAPSK